MKKTAIKQAVMVFALMSAYSMAQAAEQEPVVDAKRFYAGGGLGFHHAGGGNAQGFQFFAGYDFKFVINDDIASALEIGYMDSGKFDYFYGGTTSSKASGLWASMVETVPLTSKAGMLARLGYDFGDDDGFLIGAGMQYKFNTKAAMRMEYVTRQHISGLQVNALFHF